MKPLMVHGLRHTAATLMLLAGVPVHVVAATWLTVWDMISLNGDYTNPTSCNGPGNMT